MANWRVIYVKIRIRRRWGLQGKYVGTGYCYVRVPGTTSAEVQCAPESVSGAGGVLYHKIQGLLGRQ